MHADTVAEVTWMDRHVIIHCEFTAVQWCQIEPN